MMNISKSPSDQNIVKKQQRSLSSRLSVNIKPEIPKQGILKQSKINSHSNSLISLLYGDLNNPKYGDLSDIQLLKSIQTKSNQFQSQYLSNQQNIHYGPPSKDYKSSQNSYYQYKEELKQYEMNQNFLKQEEIKLNNLKEQQQFIQSSAKNTQDTKILIKDQQIKGLLNLIDSESKSPSPVRQITSNFSDIYQLRSDINKKNEIILELQLKIDKDKLNYYTKFQQLEEEWRFKYKQMETNLMPGNIQKKIEKQKLQINQQQEQIQFLQEHLDDANSSIKKLNDDLTQQQTVKQGQSDNNNERQELEQYKQNEYKYNNQRQEIEQYIQNEEQYKLQLNQLNLQISSLQSKINQNDLKIPDQKYLDHQNNLEQKHNNEINLLNEKQYQNLQKYLILCVNYEFQEQKFNQNEIENQQTIFQLQKQLQESHEQFQTQFQNKELLIKQEQAYNSSMQVQIQLNDSQTKKIKDLNEEILLLSENLEIIQQKYIKEQSNQKQTLKELDLCLIELDKQKQEHRNNIQELQKEINQKDQQMIDSIQNLSNEMDLLVEERQKEQNLLKNLQQELQQQQYDYQEQIQEKNDKIQKLEKSIKQLHLIQQEDLKNLEEKYESKFEKLNDDKDYIKQLQNDKKALQKSKQELQDQVHNFQEKCAQVEKQLEKKNSFQDKMIEQLKGQIIDLQKVGQDAQTDYEVFQKKQIEKENISKKEYQLSLQNLQENLDEQFQKVKQLEEDKLNIQKQVQYVVKTQLEKELVQLNDMHEEEKQKLKNQIQNLDNYAQNQILENNKLWSENNQLQNEIQQLQEQLSIQIKSNNQSQDKMAQQYKQLQQESKEQAMKVQKYFGIINLQENQIKELNDQIQLDKEQHQNNLNTYQKDVEHQVEQQVNGELQKLLEKFQKEQQKNEQKIQRVIFENQQLKLEIDDLQEQLKNQKQDVQQQQYDFQQQNALNQHKMQIDLEEQKNIMEQQIVQIVNAKLMELTNKNNEEKNKMQNQILELCEQLQESNSQNAILFNTIKEFQHSLDLKQKVQFVFDEIDANTQNGNSKENHSPYNQSIKHNNSKSELEFK